MLLSTGLRISSRLRTFFRRTATAGTYDDRSRDVDIRCIPTEPRNLHASASMAYEMSERRAADSKQQLRGIEAIGLDHGRFWFTEG